MPKKKEFVPEFKYDGFPVIVTHKDGKDLKDFKICHFDSKVNAQKYIDRCKFKKKDYDIYIKGENE
jgi:hypothetical protein